MRLCESKYTRTMPRASPSGRNILATSRYSLLILPFGCTVRVVSAVEHDGIRLIVMRGEGALSCACIHGGASPAAAGCAPSNPNIASSATIGRRPAEPAFQCAAAFLAASKITCSSSPVRTIWKKSCTES